MKKEQISETGLIAITINLSILELHRLANLKAELDKFLADPNTIDGAMLHISNATAFINRITDDFLTTEDVENELFGIKSNTTSIIDTNKTYYLYDTHNVTKFSGTYEQCTHLKQLSDISKEHTTNDWFISSHVLQPITAEPKY